MMQNLSQRNYKNRNQRHRFPITFFFALFKPLNVLALLSVFTLLLSPSFSLGKRSKNNQNPKKESSKNSREINAPLLKLPPSRVKHPKPLQKLPQSLSEWWLNSIEDYHKGLKKKSFLLNLKKQQEEEKEKEKERLKKRSKPKKPKPKIEDYTVDLSALQKPKKKIENFFLKYFISDKPPPYVGKIIAPDSSLPIRMLYQNQKAIVRLKNNVQVDDELRIYRTYKMGFLFNVHHSVEIIGTVRILQNVQRNLFQVLITKSFEPILVGDYLTLYPLSKISLSSDFSSTTTSQKTKIYAIPQNQTPLLNIYSTVYLNRGVKNGLQTDQVLAIHENTRLRRQNTVSKTSPLIGWLKIAKVEKNRSTAIILEAKKTILIGDYVGLPPPGSAFNTNEMTDDDVNESALNEEIDSFESEIDDSDQITDSSESGIDDSDEITENEEIDEFDEEFENEFDFSQEEIEEPDETREAKLDIENITGEKKEDVDVDVE